MAYPEDVRRYDAWGTCACTGTVPIKASGTGRGLATAQAPPRSPAAAL